MVQIALFTAATEVKPAVGFEVQSPDLMSASHRED
jgi:hypothetical protein